MTDPGSKERGGPKDPDYSKRENDPKKDRVQVERRTHEHLSDKEIRRTLHTLKNWKANKKLKRQIPGIDFQGPYFQKRIKELEEELEFRSRDEEMGESWKQQLRGEE